MFAAAAGHSTLGIPQSVGQEFADADKGGHLPAKAKDMEPSKWAKLKELVSQWLTEEAAEPEHAARDAEPPRIRAAGVAFVTPTGDCLFLRRSRNGDHAGEWALPGGRVENGETPEQAALREAREETGADCTADRLRPAHEHTFDGVRFSTHFHPVADRFEPRLNNEHTEYKWAPPDAPPAPLHPGVRRTLGDLLDGVEKGGDDSAATSANSGVPQGHGSGDPNDGGYIEPPPKKTEDDTIDTATVDIPLLIRLMEYAREDAPDDEALHSAAERLITLAQAENRPLEMEDYERIVADAETAHDPKTGQFTSGSTASSDPESVGKEIGISTERGAKTGMYNAPYAALRVALKDPSKIDASIDRLTSMKVSSGLGREFGESHESYYERNPDIKRQHVEADKVIEYLKSMKKGQDAAPDPTGKLSATTREDVDSAKHRADMPADAFLGPNRTYPVKEQRDGKWKYTRNLLLAAARRARMQGRDDLARRADAIRAREFGKEAKDSGLNASGHLTVGPQRDPRGDFGWAMGKGAVGTGPNVTRMSRAVASGNERLQSLTGDAAGPPHDPKNGQFTSTQHSEQSAYHKERQAHHEAEAKSRGETSTSPYGSHGNAGSQHYSAAFYHGKAAENPNDESYIKQAHRNTTLAEQASKKVAQLGGKTPEAKPKAPEKAPLTAQQHSARRIAKHLATNRIRLRGSRRGDQALDAALALDRALAADKREIDHDGRLHVDQANITKAMVCPYLGSEINSVMKDTPGWKMLEPEKRYNLLRPADEIEKAASTFNGLPLLWVHRPASAEAHPHEITIGATGNDATFEHPYLKNSLVVWPAYAREAIEDGSQKSLSAGYSYRAIMEPGSEGDDSWDGRMVDIIGNHLALVKDGRCGPDVAIDWSIVEQQWRNIESALLQLRG